MYAFPSFTRERPIRGTSAGPQRRAVCRRGWRVSGLRDGASGGGRSVAAGPAKRAADRPALAGWQQMPAASHAASPSPRRADRGRGRAGLSGLVGSGCGNSRQSFRAQLHGDAPAGLAGGCPWGPAVADPACGQSAAKRVARPLAGDGAAFAGEPGRSGRPRHGLVAGRIAALARQTTPDLGGQP